jgi:hypothetical protein
MLAAPVLKELLMVFLEKERSCQPEYQLISWLASVTKVSPCVIIPYKVPWVWDVTH